MGAGGEGCCVGAYVTSSGGCQIGVGIVWVPVRGVEPGGLDLVHELEHLLRVMIEEDMCWELCDHYCQEEYYLATMRNVDLESLLGAGGSKVISISS